MNEKKCSKCGEFKLFTEFNKNRHKRYGLTPACKDCVVIHRLVCLSLLSDEERETLRNKRREYNQLPENKAKMKALKDAHRSANQEQVNARAREYYHENKEKVLAYGKKYRKANRGRFNNFTQIYRARIKQRTFPEQRRAIDEFYQNCPKGYHVDHIVPIKHSLVSGLHVLANLQYLSARENHMKKNKFTIE
jgi:hypothetical protein